MTCPATRFASALRSSREALMRERALFASQTFFCQTLNLLPDVVIILNNCRQTVYANQAALDFCGLKSLDEAMGQRIGELIACKHASESEGGCGTTEACRYCGAVNAILQSQDGKAAQEECRINIKASTGEEALDLRVWANPLVVDGEPFSVVFVSNIADEKRKVFLERIFLHDIMNTATALRGFSQLLNMGLVQESEREGFLTRIDHLSDKIIHEINAHRQLIAAERGELKPEFKALNSKNFLTEIFDAYNRPDMLDGRKLLLSKDCCDIDFLSDPTLLGRVVGNMTKNAIEASTPGECVTLGCRLFQDEVEFFVHNPTYMPENIRLQVFNRSFSTKGSGRGLGTYSMKYLTEKYLQGHIRFESTEANGTTFYVRYPLQPLAI